MLHLQDYTDLQIVVQEYVSHRKESVNFSFELTKREYCSYTLRQLIPQHLHHCN